jgi:hypothetical protein
VSVKVVAIVDVDLNIVGRDIGEVMGLKPLDIRVFTLMFLGLVMLMSLYTICILILTSPPQLLNLSYH